MTDAIALGRKIYDNLRKAIQYIVTGYHKIKLIENFYIDQSRVYGIMLPTVYQQTEVPTNTREEMNEGNDEVLVETNEETSFERRQEMITTIIESIQSESALSIEHVQE